jgi:hypothetical protein
MADFSGGIVARTRPGVQAGRAAERGRLWGYMLGNGLAVQFRVAEQLDSQHGKPGAR